MCKHLSVVQRVGWVERAANAIPDGMLLLCSMTVLRRRTRSILHDKGGTSLIPRAEQCEYTVHCRDRMLWLVKALSVLAADGARVWEFTTESNLGRKR